MSEDKKDEIQDGDEPKAEEPKPAVEPKPKKAAPRPKSDVVDEEELDIEIERVAPKSSSSCGPVAWILFILVIALIAIFGGIKISQERIKAEKEARAQREITYQTQEQTIRQNIEKASEFAKKGDVENAYKQLAAARDKWSEMAAMANSARDTDKAQYALSREADLKKVIDELDQYKDKAAELQERADKLAEEVKALEEERDEFNDKVNARILELAGSGGVAEAEAAATGAKPEASEEKKAEAEEAKADDEETEADKPEDAKIEKKSAKKSEGKAKDSEKKADARSKKSATEAKKKKTDEDEPEAPKTEKIETGLQSAGPVQ
ncbi:MAG: hypothetical protein HPY44_15810 [Armatimonadetes bacterium]|nr:hypothetical protein [Armatimonadota bacterium]